jgi:LytS/YehU family sensor histidine kinase
MFALLYIIPTMTVKLMIIGIASSIKIAKIWIISQKRQQNLIKEKLEINLRLKESELKHLKSQLNPHFLFNALNNLYGLTLEGSSKAPEVVLKISSLLDYILYKCDGPTIDLETEIENVKNYIDLQKIRYGEDTNIEIAIKGNPCGISIAPLLILPLVENAFKHGLDKNVGKGFVKIVIEINTENNFVVYVENSLKGENNHEGEGIGLKNLKKRLELQYPQKYHFVVNNNSVIYSTKLSINLS